MKRFVAVVLGLAVFAPGVAQQSPSFRLDEHNFDGAGHPQRGATLYSESFRITMDSLGDSVLGPDLGSASFTMNGTFLDAYPPPGEVRGLVFTGPSALEWEADESAGRYNMYRDLLSSLAGLGYGACFRAGLEGTSETDLTMPPTGNGWFYLVTVENRLLEEGTKGYDSDGGERANAAPCP